MIFDFSNPVETTRRFLASGLTSCDDTPYHEMYERLTGMGVCNGLLPHQIEGVAFLASRHGAILADDMGLGKTCQAIVSTLVEPSLRLPALIICPSGLRHEWEREILRVKPEATIALPSLPSEWSPCEFTVISFSRLKDFFGWDTLPLFKSLFLDESQAFKNASAFNKQSRNDAHSSLNKGETPKGHRTALAIEIAKMIPNVFCLTGTPILSRPRELFNLLKLIRNPLANDFITFSKRYCDGHKTFFGWVADGCTNPVELRELLKNSVLRRLKKDVISLPPKTTITTRLNLHGEFISRYKFAWSNYLDGIKTTHQSGKRQNSIKARHLVELNLLRQICSLSKVDYLSERIMKSKEKCIIFTTFKDPVSALSSSFDSSGVGHVTYTGGMTEADRNSAVMEFRNNPNCRVFLSNLEAGKTGLNLVEATRVIFLDMGWTPADHFQAEDRAHRIGQTSPVTCEYLFTVDTVDELMLSILSEKKSVIDRIFGDDVESSHSPSDFDIQGDFFERIQKECSFPARPARFSPSNTSSLAVLF